MPIYEYQCQACENVFELLQKVDAPAPEACETCGKGPVQKLMSRTGFILKGGGWYETDFRGGGSRTAEPKKKEETAASGGDAKPAESKAAEAKTETAAPAAAAPAAPATPKAAGST